MQSIYGKCPFATTQRVLQGKWAIVVLFQLSSGKKRFNQLEKSLPEITRTALTRQLRQLEEDKLIIRTVYPEVPPRVEYLLSPIGDKFKKVLDEIEIFGLDYIAQLIS
ncbi:Transcription regulator [Paracholeplasma brassicae]|uniref:Transcription regulator n=1 Tax=Acholeplasma brassicae TaxID=61635 RepID=U4KS46_9MOLU|nr:helix-turn-helix domain-containing protein [Paracholeplasma brassicae]CCV66313.1 Transcription regulator [Paracholeplasma brassicae]